MKAVIDTSSLLSLVRYYLPFDKNNVLYNYFEAKVLNREIIIIDKVHEECIYTSKGIVTEKLKYLNNNKNIVKTDGFLPTNKFFNQLENQFINGAIKNLLSSVEFENRKNAYLDSADAKLLLYCIKDRRILDEKPKLITEESEISNDNKSFKKLPAICKILDIEVLTLPKLLEIFKDIEFNII